MASQAGETSAGAANGGTAPNAAELFGDTGEGAAGAAHSGESGPRDGQGAAAGEGAEGAAAGDLAHSGGNGVDPAWYAELSGEVADGETSSVKDWVKSKNFKDVTALARSAWHAEKALGDSGKVKVPGDKASEAEIKAYHHAIGVPDDAKGYEIPEIKDADGNAVEMNTPLIERLAGAALKAGVPKAGFAAVVNDFVLSQMEELAGQDAEQRAEANAKLKEWGTAKAGKMAAVNQALAALELNKDEALRLRAALGAGRSMELFAKLGEGLAEDRMLDGGSGKRFGVTGTEAQDQINQMRADAAVRDKIMVPGTPERARYERLLKIVGEDAERKARDADMNP